MDNVKKLSEIQKRIKILKKDKTKEIEDLQKARNYIDFKIERIKRMKWIKKNWCWNGYKIEKN